MISSVATVVLAFGAGFAMKYSGLCLYGALREAYEQKRLWRIGFFIGIIAFATTTLLLLYLLGALKTPFLSHTRVGHALFFGFVMGVGSAINRGCFFGTFVALVGGNLHYLSTLFGLFAGVAIAILFAQTLQPQLHLASVLAYPTYGITALGIAFCTACLSVAVFWIKPTRPKALHPFFMGVIGISGALLYAFVPGWNYGDILSLASASVVRSEPFSPGTLTLTATIAMIAGGIVSALYTKSFALQPIRSDLVIRFFLAGALMGFSAYVLPGGNDGMILKGVGLLALHAVFGLGGMFAGIWLFLMLS